MSQGIRINRRFTTRAGEQLDPMSLEQGRLVVVELELEADRTIENLVIEDLLPAGLEIENANLASAENLEEGNEGESNLLWAVRTEARDDRMVAFVNFVSEKPAKKLLRYAARAVTQGQFVLPSAQVSCMYDPDVLASSNAGTVKVVARK
jgi:hypothetical protein